MSERPMWNGWRLVGALVLAAALGAALFAIGQSLVPGLGKRAEIERVVHAYLLDHPEIIPEAVQKLQQREAERAAQAEQDAVRALPGALPGLRTPYAGAWAGNPRGDVTIVAFMDYACGYCRASLPGLDELLKRDPNVRIVYREYPVLGPESQTAARWALAAAEQGRFRPFHDALFAADGPSQANIAAAAKAAGLDMNKAQAAIGSAAVRGEIQGNRALGEKLAMTGTPSWVIGGKLYYGMRDYDALAEAVADARKGG